MHEHEQRIERAGDALEAYRQAGGGDPADTKASLVDLATDLLHLATAMHEHDPTTGVESAADWLQRLSRHHFNAERLDTQWSR